MLTRNMSRVEHTGYNKLGRLYLNLINFVVVFTKKIHFLMINVISKLKNYIKLTEPHNRGHIMTTPLFFEVRS